MGLQEDGRTGRDRGKGGLPVNLMKPDEAYRLIGKAFIPGGSNKMNGR